MSEWPENSYMEMTHPDREVVPGMSMKELGPILAESYREALDRQLKASARVFGYLPDPPKLTRKQKLVKKWREFWNHIPDFIDYIKEYKYDDWRYWDKDGF